MDEFLNEMADILEEDSVGANDELNNFESWDSLAVLSVVALADDQFGVNMSAQDITDSVTIGDLYQRIRAKKTA